MMRWIATVCRKNREVGLQGLWVQSTSRSWLMQPMSSSEALQHAQPFSSSTNSTPSPLLVRIPLLERSLTSFASMFMDATSFTTTPTLSPPLL